MTGNSTKINISRNEGQIIITSVEIQTAVKCASNLSKRLQPCVLGTYITYELIN